METIFTIAASADDGEAWKQAATYPPGGGISWTDDAASLFPERGLNVDYFIFVVCMRWDTSSIPDTDTVTGAALRVAAISKADADGDRAITADWYDHGGMGTEDYIETAQTGAITAIDLGGLATTGDVDLPLEAVAANINKTGFTGLRLHINGGIPIAGENYYEFASWDHATLAPPRLVVQHSPVTDVAYVANVPLVGGPGFTPGRSGPGSDSRGGIR